MEVLKRQNLRMAAMKESQEHLKDPPLPKPIINSTAFDEDLSRVEEDPADELLRWLKTSKNNALRLLEQLRIEIENISGCELTVDRCIMLCMAMFMFFSHFSRNRSPEMQGGTPLRPGGAGGGGGAERPAAAAAGNIMGNIMGEQDGDDDEASAAK